MNRSIFFIFGIFALFLTILAGASSAQSNDRDHPTLLTTDTITGNLEPNNLETFYSLSAGPGELTITVDVKARPHDIGVLNFEILARDASRSLLCCEFAQGDDGGAGRDVKTIKLAKRQTVILHLTTGPVGGGTYSVRFSGAKH